MLNSSLFARLSLTKAANMSDEKLNLPSTSKQNIQSSTNVNVANKSFLKQVKEIQGILLPRRSNIISTARRVLKKVITPHEEQEYTATTREVRLDRGYKLAALRRSVSEPCLQVRTIKFFNVIAKPIIDREKTNRMTSDERWEALQRRLPNLYPTTYHNDDDEDAKPSKRSERKKKCLTYRPSTSRFRPKTPRWLTKPKTKEYKPEFIEENKNDQEYLISGDIQNQLQILLGMMADPDFEDDSSDAENYFMKIATSIINMCKWTKEDIDNIVGNEMGEFVPGSLTPRKFLSILLGYYIQLEPDVIEEKTEEEEEEEKVEKVEVVEAVESDLEDSD